MPGPKSKPETLLRVAARGRGPKLTSLWNLPRLRRPVTNIYSFGGAAGGGGGKGSGSGGRRSNL